MVERKDTLAFIEFLRGKYKSIYNVEYIQLLFNRLSIHEKEKLISYEFNELWKMLWIHTDTINRKIQNEYKTRYFRKIFLWYHHEKQIHVSPFNQQSKP